MKWINGLSLLAIGLTIIGLCVHLPVVLASTTLSVLIMSVGALFIGLGFRALGIKTPAQEYMQQLEDETQYLDKETAKTSREHAEAVGQSLPNDLSAQTISSQPVEEQVEELKLRH
jgi:hypothetical protein